VVKILGTGFTTPILIEVLQALQVVGACYAFGSDVLNDGREQGDLSLFSLDRTQVFAGTPALSDGVYDLRVTTAGGPSNILDGALTYQLFAEEVKAQHARQKLMAKWKTGRRLLTTGAALT